MIETRKSACFTGSRVEKLPFKLDLVESYERYLSGRLEKAIIEAINAGYTRFYNGGCTGIDIMAGELIHHNMELWEKSYETETSDIELYTVVPFMDQSDGWSREWQLRYSNLLFFSDKVIYLHEHEYANNLPFQTKADFFNERNRYMVDHSELVIAAYNGKPGGSHNTVKYAKKLRRDIVFINTMPESSSAW